MSININIEKLKKDTNSDDIIASLYYYAVFGEKITQNDLERFKWYGIYSQDEKQTLFNLKIPLNLGELDTNQLSVISKISKEYAQNGVKILNGQKIELENVKLFNIPNIFNLLEKIGLSTLFESSHSIKRVLTCPANRVDGTQIYNVEPIAKKLNNTFVANKNFFNLPNSLQIAISGYIEGCDIGFTPDVSFNATKDSNDKVIFTINILDTNIGYIPASKILNITRAIANIYKDFGQREEQKNSDFRSFIEYLELVNFNNILSSMLDFKIQDSYLINAKIEPKKPRMGINESTIEGLSYIGFKSKDAKFSKKDLEKLILDLEKFEATKLKITHKSNIIVLDVPTKNSQNLISSLKDIALVI